MIYNPLKRGPRAWATSHRLKRCESTDWVKGGKTMSGNKGVAKVAGNGNYGFRTRAKGDDVSMEIGLDGQYIRKNRYVRRKKNVSKLLTNNEIAMSSTDPLIAKKRKLKQKRNRNRGAAYGRRRRQSS